MELRYLLYIAQTSKQFMRLYHQWNNPSALSCSSLVRQDEASVSPYVDRQNMYGLMHNL